jgi:hypothetical protein
MSGDPVSDARHWMVRAVEMRAFAQSAKTIDDQAKMLKIVDDYDKLARRALQRANGSKWPPHSN